MTRVALKSTPVRLGPTVTSALPGANVYSGSSGVTGSGSGSLAEGRTATPSTGGQPFAVPGLVAAALGLLALRVRLKARRAS